MKSVLKRKFAIFGASALVSLISTSAMAARAAKEQVDYLTTIANGLGVLGVAVLFFVGVVVFGFGGFFFVRDYVMAKDDREKKFSIGPLIMAIIVGSMLCYPGGAMMLGSDLTTDQTDAKVSSNDFKRNP